MLSTQTYNGFLMALNSAAYPQSLPLASLPPLDHYTEQV